MIAVSDSWKKANQRFLLPETFVEISCGMTDIGVADLLNVSGENEAVFSNTGDVVKNAPGADAYATLEHNLWVLDGSRSIVPNTAPYGTPGYVSQDDSNMSVVMSLEKIRSHPIPGLTITWSTENGEYATDFEVTVKRGDAVVATTRVTGNESVMSEVALEMREYDSVIVEVLNWCLPDRRARIDLISFGHVVTFSKNNILSFSHEQYGCLNSGEIPKNSIEFKLDNTDGRWNPNNPVGTGKYLSERQPITVRYGLNIDGVTEWINAGKWYLSDWKAPSNGLEASFSARDIFEYMLNEPYTGDTSGTLSHLVSQAFSSSNLPDDFVANVDPVLGNYTVTLTSERTAAEVVQLCANTARCVIWQDREGVLNVVPHNIAESGYSITSGLSYSHPEVTLSKPLRAVSVSYGEEKTYVLTEGASGETQTLDNPFITEEAQAALVASWIRDALRTRKTVTGEFRADPRLDLFDVVAVDSKYGTLYPVAITNIKYTYSGAFRGHYEGRVIGGVNQNALGEFVLDESTLV